MDHSHPFRQWPALLCALLFLLSAPASAGTSCEQGELQPTALRDGMAMAMRTLQVLEQSDAQTAIVGRIGSDLSEHGLRYSHAGIVVRDHPKGRWIFVHELNQCATDRSDIFDEGLANFFLDAPFLLEAYVIVPDEALQRRIRDVLSGRLVRTLHNPTYSMIAHPDSDRYQNSNQWVLNVLAAAMANDGEVVTWQQAQRYLREHGYQADRIHISAMKRLGAKMFSANVMFDDHSTEERFAKSYLVATVRSISRFLERNGHILARKIIPQHGPVTDAPAGHG